jgi:hypothetical protein
MRKRVSRPFTSKPLNRTISTRGQTPVLVPDAQGRLKMFDPSLPINETARTLATDEYHAAINPDAADNEVSKGLLFATGTEGYVGGSLDFKANYTAQWDECVKGSLPCGEAADKHLDTIASESRADVVEPVSNWRINLSGNAQRMSDGFAVSTDFAVREAAYKQFCQITKAPAYNANAGLSTFKGKRDHRVRVRRIQGEALPEIYAVTGGPGDGRAYAPFDSDKLVDSLRKICPDTRLKVDYDQPTTECRVKAYFMAPLDLLEFGAGVGRVHHVYMDWRTADNGTMSLSGSLGIVRAVCRNSGLAHHKKASVTLRHSGNYERLAQAVTTLNEGMAEVVDSLRKVWQRALTEQYTDRESGSALSPQEAIKRLVAQGMVPLAGESEESATERYIDAWSREPVYSAGGIVMAIQRAAHEGSWSTKWAEDQIEESASELLYQRVYVLDEPTIDA